MLTRTNPYLVLLRQLFLACPTWFRPGQFDAMMVRRMRQISFSSDLVFCHSQQRISREVRLSDCNSHASHLLTCMRTGLDRRTILPDFGRKVDGKSLGAPRSCGHRESAEASFRWISNDKGNRIHSDSGPYKSSSARFSLTTGAASLVAWWVYTTSGSERKFNSTCSELCNEWEFESGGTNGSVHDDSVVLTLLSSTQRCRYYNLCSTSKSC
jgi:hypothetical protein